MIAAGPRPESPAAGAAGDGRFESSDTGSGVRLIALVLLVVATVLWLTTASLPMASALEAGSVTADGGAASDRARFATARVAVNSASAAELCALPGVGPGLAGRIAAERSARGPFTSVDDLDRVSGIGPAIVERLRPFVRVD